MYPSISFIIPTSGRASLEKTVASIEKWPGDEIIVIKHNPPSGHWGNEERQEGTEKAKGDYIAYIDDDDTYVPGHREIMNTAINEIHGCPFLFKIQYPNGRVLWRKKWEKNGNISTQMILVPNIPEMFYGWDETHHWADFWFIHRWMWPSNAVVWRDEILVHMGHNDEKFELGLTLSEARKRKVGVYK